MDELLKENLKYLGLTHMSKVFDELALKAAEGGAQPADFAAELIAGEAAARRERAVERRVRHARFPVVKTVGDFDWAEAPFLQRGLVEFLFRLDFVREKRNVVFIGSPGTGKTHLAIALGHQACTHGFTVLFGQAVDIVNDLAEAKAEGRCTAAMRKYRTPDLLVVDELGYLATDSRGADLFFQLVSARYESGSMVVTSNLGYKDWVNVFAGNKALAAAILDRVCDKCTTVLTEGPSFRMKRRDRDPKANNVR